MAGSATHVGLTLALGLMKQQTIALAVLIFLGLITGIATQYPTPFLMPEPVAWLLVVLYGITIFFWYRADAKQMSFQRPRWLDIAVLIFATGAIPYYLIRSRGWKRGLLGLGAAILVFVAFCLASSLGGMGVVAVRILFLERPA